MRGKGVLNASGAERTGITPAYAGKSTASATTTCRTGDHPRVCGEKALVLLRLPFQTGSPPRMRGKVLNFIPAPVAIGITPAYAGKSRQRPQPCYAGQDHPRVCGEKSSMSRLFSLYSGSPPRMRGKVDSGRNVQGKVGITPAYAGKSSLSQADKAVLRDHPRVCGEKLPGAEKFESWVGSPPRMRGKAYVLTCVWFHTGITPAYAGKRAHRVRPQPL